MVSMANTLGKKKKMSVADIAIIAFIVALSITCIVPFLYMIALSFSSNEAIIAQKVGLWPVGFTPETYKTILTDVDMLYTLGYSIVLTVFYTVVCMFLTICAAYPLTKKRLMGRNFILTALVFTMYFSGGLIPGYLLIKNLGLTDSFWVYIIPGIIGVFNMIVIRSFIEGLPEGILESARIDGAGEFTTFLRVVLPLTIPSLATVSLFVAVGQWNSWFDVFLYNSSNPKLSTLQYELMKILQTSNTASTQSAADVYAQSASTHSVTPTSIRATMTIIASVPILMVYPFVQKYFVQGMTVGGVKG